MKEPPLLTADTAFSWCAPAAGMPLLMAHRGAPTQHPENTVASFRAALSAGAQVVEMDVRTSQDGALVVIHDATIDRVSHSRGPVAALTLAQLQAVQLKGPGAADGRDTCIPSLEDVLEAFPRAAMNVDLKAVTAAGVAHAFEVIRRVRSRPGAHLQVLLTSSCADTQRAIATHNAAGEVVLGMGRADVLRVLKAAWLRRPPIDQLRGRACQMPAYVTLCGLHLPLLRGPLVPYLRAMGCPLHVWWDHSRMVDDTDQLQACRSWGVDGIFTDRIEHVVTL